MRQSEEGRVRVGTVFSSGAVYAKIVRHRNGTQKITYHCPETEIEVVGEDIVWSREVLAFRERFLTTSVLADKLDSCMALAG